MLANLGISINNQSAGSSNSSTSALTSIQLKNVAAVMVTAVLPPFARPGEAIDVTVSSLGNAKSLRGGTLLLTPMKGADGALMRSPRATWRWAAPARAPTAAACR